MFQKVLVANRGEIAVRVIRALREMGIRSVAIYAKEDEHSLHVQLADQRACIGDDFTHYFNKERIVTSALVFEANAIHPGCGFLAESPDFAYLCAKNKITFIGPPAGVLENLNGKTSIDNLKGSQHIEIQLIADNHGNIITSCERIHTIRQKERILLSESPSPAISPAMRKALEEAAAVAARETGYINAGTAKFVLDDEGNFELSKIKPCIQAGHGITEMVMGMDLAIEQIRVAAGESLNLFSDVKMTGHAMECRIYPEPTVRGLGRTFCKVTNMHLPSGNGIRVDTALYTGCEISHDCNEPIAQILVHAPTRKRAAAKMRSTLDETVILGVDTNLDFLFQTAKAIESE
ncbi:MAG: hypothetical protein FWG90_06130 [Oscillospiraceae bacterium]|nr:hypothetical protein [Oscillospiraceae bacterium]